MTNSEQKLCALRKLNFQKILKFNHEIDVESYDYLRYKENNYQHQKISGYCIACEELGCSHSSEDNNYKLTNISHGTHSSDIFQSLFEKIDISNWYQDPIMFVFESPSLDYGIFQDLEFNGVKKRPSKLWYWIHQDQSIVTYPDKFRGMEYGAFVLSAILTFKIANAYITNLIKCGMNNSEGKYKGLNSYKQETIEKCYDQILSEEIEIHNPKVIFAFGSNVERQLIRLTGNKRLIQQLPHPAGQQRGFRNEHYKAIFFWNIIAAMHKVGIISTEDGCEFARIFLEKYDNSAV